MDWETAVSSKQHARLYFSSLGRVVISAVLWDGSEASLLEIAKLGSGPIEKVGRKLVIVTQEGDMTASIGDWVIRGVNGETYPCKADVFNKTYEPVSCCACCCRIQIDDKPQSQEYRDQ
jgi:hypothetical protein